MKIVHLTTVDLSLRYLLYPQMAAAVAAGNEVIGVSAAGPEVQWLEERGIRHIALHHSTRSMHVLADLRAAREFARIVRTERPDVVHTHNPKPGVYGRIVARLCGVPRVVNTVHGLYATRDNSWQRRAVVYGLEAAASRFSHVELVQNPEDFALMRRTHMAPRRKLRLLGNGVDLDRFYPNGITPDARRALRDLWGVDDDDVVVGTVGRLVREKGYDELFAAAESFPPGVVLVVAGPSEAAKEDAVSDAAVCRAQEHGVRTLGHRDDVEALYGAFDMFVLASHREGFPRAAMEAAASGLGLVVTDIRGCRQVVDPGINGDLVPPRDSDALAAAITLLAADPKRRRRYALASRNKAEAEFNERVIVDRVLGAYQSRHRGSRGAASLTVKRWMDVVAACGGLAVLSPLFALVALLVRLRLGRPVLFVQPRPGLNGELFDIIKFRTMRDARDANGELLSDADRLTPLGRWLRSWSLDELPELINVLRGDMSLVGPRPLLPEYLSHYSATQARRHEVRPGITGHAQLSGRNLTSWTERLDLDVWYVDHWSIGLDLRILFRTVSAVVRRQGISAKGHDTMPLFTERATEQIDPPADARSS